MSLVFALEGIQKEHIYDPVFQGFIDLHNYGMTEDYFRGNRRLIPLAKRLLCRDITQLPSVKESSHHDSFIKSGALTWCPSPEQR